MIKKFTLYSLSLLPFYISADTLSINITGVGVNQGNLYVGVFNSKTSFPAQNKTFQNKIIPGATAKIKATFEVPAGSYAIAVYQDHNKNKRLDTNFLGIPKERYGFSGKKVFGKPDFEDAKIHISGNKILTIYLK